MDNSNWINRIAKPIAGVNIFMTILLVSYITIVTTEQGDLTVFYIPFSILILLPYFVSSTLTLLDTKVSEQKCSNWMIFGMVITVLTTAPLPFFYEIGGFFIFLFFLSIVGIAWYLRKKRTRQGLLMSIIGILLIVLINNYF